MERENKGDEKAAEGSVQSDADIVETAGETTAAATGPSEIEAAEGETGGASLERPVGADTRVKVAGEQDSIEG